MLNEIHFSVKFTNGINATYNLLLHINISRNYYQTDCVLTQFTFIRLRISITEWNSQT